MVTERASLGGDILNPKEIGKRRRKQQTDGGGAAGKVGEEPGGRVSRKPERESASAGARERSPHPTGLRHDGESTTGTLLHRKGSRESWGFHREWEGRS